MVQKLWRSIFFVVVMEQLVERHRRSVLALWCRVLRHIWKSPTAVLRVARQAAPAGVDGGDGIGFQKAVDDMSHRAMGELEVADSDERSASAAFVPAANQLEVRLAASANGVFVWLFFEQ
jgi:hypothetical protein